jgi:FixJ family two-component response regulator
MEAINRGAIHRFCTKPLNSLVLRENVREAFRHHALLQDGKRRQAQDAEEVA